VESVIDAPRRSRRWWVAEVDLVRQRDVGKAELDRLGEVGAGGVQLARLQGRLEGGLREDLELASLPPERHWQWSPDAEVLLRQLHHHDEALALRIRRRVGAASLKPGVAIR